MYVRHYGLLLGLAASGSLLLLAGCGTDLAAGPDTAAGTAPTAQAPVRKVDTDPTDQTIWTVLGLAKRQSQMSGGPQTGNTVSPELWQAAHDALGFAGIASEDPVTGLVQTKWYTPPGKVDERLRVSVFILSRALRSDSVALNIERQTRAPGSGDAGWQKQPVAREVADDLDNDILLRARQIHAEHYREQLNGAS